MSAVIGAVRFDSRTGLPIVRINKSPGGGRALGFVLEGESIARPTATGVPVSLALDVAKVQTRAQLGTSSPSFDPSAGIFGTIGRVLGGAVTGFLAGGPVGAGLGAIGGVIGAPAAPAPVRLPPAGIPGFGGGRIPTTQDVRGALRIGGGEAEIGLPGGFSARFQPPTFQAGTQIARRAPGPVATTAGIGCAAGFHPNKTGYFLRDGSFVAPETRCVKNRRRNPANPRALSRSIARIKSAKRLSSQLAQITVRKPKCPN